MTKRIVGLLAIGLVAVLTAGCISNNGLNNNSNLNSNPPEAIKEINASKDGHDGITVYFVLTDKDGKPTTSDGTAMLNIGIGSPLLYTKTYDIHKSDFKEMPVGQGIYANKEIICSLGYIPYTQFSEKPYTHSLEYVPYRDSSTVTLYFKTPDGKTLRGLYQIQWE